MSDRNLRSVERIDYAVLHSTGDRTPYNQIRETPRDSDGSSEDSSSGSENSQDRTLVLSESEVEGLASLSEELERLSVVSTPTDSSHTTHHSLFVSTPTDSSHTTHHSLFLKMGDPVELRKLLSTRDSLHDDIIDFMDENPITDLHKIEDVNLFVARLEELRSKYRNVYKEACMLIDDDEDQLDQLKESCDKVLVKVKQELSEAKRVKNDIRGYELKAEAHARFKKTEKEQEEVEKQEHAIQFLFLEVDRSLIAIRKEVRLTNISSDRSVLSDEDLIEMKKRLPAIQQRIDNFSGKYKELLKLVPDREGVRRTKLDSLANDYDIMLNEHAKYQTLLQRESNAREINKEKKFQTSSLKINVPKFKGYDSSLDFYSFKDKFEQLHLQDVPERALPELLKNNYLEGPALESVKRLQTIREIWENLKKSFGDPRVMMSKKLSELDSIGYLGKVREAEKVKDGLNKVVNVMEDLMKLAADHHIEEKLYYGDSIYSIYRILGDAKVTKFIEQNCEVELNGVDLWKELLKFLEKDIKVQLEKSMIYRALPEKTPPVKDNKEKPNSKSHHTDDKPNNLNNKGDSNNGASPPDNTPPNNKNKDEKLCHLCGKDDHIATRGPYGKKFIQYFACKDFVDASCSQRFAELKKKGFCTQCLFPGAYATSGKHVEGKCQSTYICRHDSHKNFTVKKHILVCEEHKDEEDNKAILEEYRARCIDRKCNKDLPEYAKTIQLSHFCAHPTFATLSPGEEDEGDGIYMFQEITVNGERFTIFFDNGCGKSVFTHDAVNRLGGNATQLFDGMVELGGVGGCKLNSPHGSYQISLPLHDRQNAVLSGLVIDQITNKFPMYALNSEVEHDIHEAFARSSGDVKKLPRLPASVGGHVDIMIGVQYLKFFPKEIFRTLAGLTIYSSPFASTDGSRGVVAGPHASFRITNNNFYTHAEQTAFFTAQMKQIRESDNLHDRFSMKSHQDEVEHDIEDDSHDYVCCTCLLVSRNRRLFEEVENAGSVITYRCVKCRDCQNCKAGERIDTVSLREEVEQDVIDKSVTVDLETRTTTATLPFMQNPVINLEPNEEQALLVYKGQLRKLSKDPQAKADVISSHNQLLQLGFVQYVKNLTPAQRKRLFSAALRYFIPWRVVWNYNSISTICRVVFDASMPTKSGKGLNDVLAKGRNQYFVGL